ncbi:hypothetical protein Pan216_34710 [Planctomycetes bacterium Pan216]|uniref:Uncharacterized protein n=1 Tax=Kolteria novifilia TaxID=2527975 RepID=A0A518B6K5_9BACT|nr:hypothetical protein Pan216_34710 [Planctomycetes bacterium Pan216]
MARMLAACIIAGVCLQGTGCALYKSAFRNICHEHKRKSDEYFAKRRDRAVAKKVWAEIRDSSPDCTYSVDYADGFKEGFVDFVRYGSPDVPRPLPPRKYWRNRYQTPQGLQAMEDWFAGFDHGMAAAHDGGYRSFVVIPTQVPELGRVADQYRVSVPPAPGSADNPVPPDDLPEEQVLPLEGVDELLEESTPGPSGATFVLPNRSESAPAISELAKPTPPTDSASGFLDNAKVLPSMSIRNSVEPKNEEGAP